MEKTNRTKQLAESAVMVAAATVLSLITVIKMPYGGSVTPFSMLPIDLPFMISCSSLCFKCLLTPDWTVALLA